MSQTSPINVKSLLAQLEVVSKDRNEKGLRDIFQILQKAEDAISTPNPLVSQTLIDPEIYGTFQPHPNFTMDK